MTTHLAFEFGVASTIATLRFDEVSPTDDELREVRAGNFLSVYQRKLGVIADMNMYEEFAKKGWTRHLANETKKVLMPHIITAVALGWYAAIIQAEKQI